MTAAKVERARRRGEAGEGEGEEQGRLHHDDDDQHVQPAAQGLQGRPAAQPREGPGE